MEARTIPTPTDPAVAKSAALLDEVLAGYGPRDFAVRFWDGTVQEPDAGRPARWTLVLTHPGSVRAMFLPPGLSTLPEAFVYGDFDVEGDIHGFTAVVRHLRALPWKKVERLRFGARLLALPNTRRPREGRQAAVLSGKPYSVERDRQAIAYHYDVGNDFYRLWLDRQLVYSCAYFERPEQSLDDAQTRKLDHVCKKLRLEPGMRLLDIGCGFGGLVLHAARHYGVEAVGVTLSQRQLEGARERIAAEGLQDRVRVEPWHYREIDASRPYDRVASVAMVEAVGDEVLHDYFRTAWSLLKPGGVFFCHGIARSAIDADQRMTFVLKYVFPDGRLRPLSKTLLAAEEVGFEVRDVESLREHYTRTLEEWVARLEARHDDAVRLTDESTYRIWRLYMALAADGFRTGQLNLHQVLFAKPRDGVSGLPATRADWYRP